MTPNIAHARILIASVLWNGTVIGVATAWKFKAVAGDVKCVVVDFLNDPAAVVGSAPGDLKVTTISIEGVHQEHPFIGLKPGPCWFIHSDKNVGIFRQLWVKNAKPQ